MIDRTYSFIIDERRMTFNFGHFGSRFSNVLLRAFLFLFSRNKTGSRYVLVTDHGQLFPVTSSFTVAATDMVDASSVASFTAKSQR